MYEFLELLTRNYVNYLNIVFRRRYYTRYEVLILALGRVSRSGLWLALYEVDIYLVSPPIQKKGKTLKPAYAKVQTVWRICICMPDAQLLISVPCTQALRKNKSRYFLSSCPDFLRVILCIVSFLYVALPYIVIVHPPSRFPARPPTPPPAPATRKSATSIDLYGMYLSVKGIDDSVVCPTKEEMDEMYCSIDIDDHDHIELLWPEAFRTGHVANIFVLHSGGWEC